MVPDHSRVRWLSRIDDLRNHISHENVTLHIYIYIYYCFSLLSLFLLPQELILSEIKYVIPAAFFIFSKIIRKTLILGVLAQITNEFFKIFPFYR